MSALANLLHDLGHIVIGVDTEEKFFLDDYRYSDIVVKTFSEIEYNDKYIYIIGNAFLNSIYYQKIKQSNLKNYTYPYFIEHFIPGKHVGVAGSHGKTSVTTYLSILMDEKENVLIGDGTGIGNINQKYFIFEACEYRNSFLNYSFEYLIINNIDYDHPDFFLSEEEYIKSFQSASNNAKNLLINGDDKNCNLIKHNNKITFGFKKNNDWIIKKNNHHPILINDNFYHEFNIDLFGDFEFYNFASAFIMAYSLSSKKDKVFDNVLKIHRPHRRLNYLKTINGNLIFDDYAHHPSEIKASLSYLKERFNSKKIIIIFQPHTLSRTKAFLNDFISALSIADDVYLIQIFSSIRENCKDKDYLLENSNFKSYDEFNIENYSNCIICYMGAGDILKYIV